MGLSIRVLLLLLTITAATSTSLFAQEADRETQVLKAESRLRPMITNWEEDNKTVVDPRLLRDLAGQLVHFTGIFGYSGNPKNVVEATKQLVASEQRLQALVNDQLTAVAKRQVTTKAFFARLAEDIGQTADAAGWQAMGPNAYVLSDYEKELPNAPLAVSIDGMQAGEFKKFRKFLLGPGSHKIFAEDGQSWSFSVDVPAERDSSRQATQQNTGTRSGRGRKSREQR